MTLIVEEVAVLDRSHHNGDAYWDGDQTAYEIVVNDGDERDSLLVVVPRGNAFIPDRDVARHVEDLGVTLAELRSRARRPAPARRPQIALSIEPGER